MFYVVLGHGIVQGESGYARIWPLQQSMQTKDAKTMAEFFPSKKPLFQATPRAVSEQTDCFYLQSYPFRHLTVQ